MQIKPLNKFPNLKEYLNAVLEATDKELANYKTKIDTVKNIKNILSIQVKNLAQLDPNKINNPQGMKKCIDSLEEILTEFKKIANSDTFLLDTTNISVTINAAKQNLPQQVYKDRHTNLIKIKMIVKACIQIYQEIVDNLKKSASSELLTSIYNNIVEFQTFVKKEEQIASIKEFNLSKNEVISKFQSLLNETDTYSYLASDQINFSKNILEATKLVQTLNQVADESIKKQQEENSITATQRAWTEELTNARTNAEKEKIWSDYFDEFWGAATNKVKSFGKNFIDSLFKYGFDARTNAFNYFLKKLFLNYPDYFKVLTEEKFTAIYKFFTIAKKPDNLRTIIDNKEKTSILWCLDLYNQSYADFYNFLVLEENTKLSYIQAKTGDFNQDFEKIYNQDLTKDNCTLNWNQLILTIKGIVSIPLNNLDATSILGNTRTWTDAKLLPLALAKQNYSTIFTESMSNSLIKASDITKRILEDLLNIQDTSVPVPLTTRQKGIDLLLYLITIYDTQHKCNELQKYFTDLENKLDNKSFTAQELNSRSAELSNLNIEITANNIKDVVLELALALQLPKTQLGEKHLK